MKAFTDISQAKKLADILPIESADMFYRDNGIDVKLMWEHNAQKVTNPCWSLSALLAQMPCVELVSSQDNHYRAFWHEMYSKWHDNAVDACVELLNREHSAELHSCRQCAFCDWHNQYCRAKDADMGKSFMMAQKQCNYYEPKTE